jgi:hypothetical protein
MSNWNVMVLIAVFSTIGMLGCGNAQSPPPVSKSAPAGEFIVQSEPQGAMAVGDARRSVKDAEEVVLVGRIGGSAEPFVDGIAAFTLVDLKVPHCSAAEGCPTPWDYCCEQNQVKDNIATIKIVDAAGTPVPNDARELLGVKELTTVVVRGKAKRDANGNLALLADQVYVKERSPKE